MAVKRLNILVYAGTGAGIGSIHQCLYSLRRILYPRYAVIPVTGDVLLKEPWQDSCALLVMPGGRDKGYRSVLDGEGNRKISQFVRDGGSYLGLCAGGYYGSSHCEFEIGTPLEVDEPRELRFYPNTCRGSVFSGFVYDSEEGAKAAELKVDKRRFAGIDFVLPVTFKTYFNGGGLFVGAHSHQDRGDIEVLATYTQPIDVEAQRSRASGLELEHMTFQDETSRRPAAIIYRTFGYGRVILSGLHPEFAVANLNRDAKDMKEEVFDALAESDKARATFFKALVWKLGLSINQADEVVPLLTPIQLWTLDDYRDLLHTWNILAVQFDGESYIAGDQNLVTVKTSKPPWTSGNVLKTASEVLTNKGDGPQSIFPSRLSKFVEDNATILEVIPQDIDSQDSSPTFSKQAYFMAIKEYETPMSRQLFANCFGRTLLYGEVVSSTSTLLEKNPQFSNPLKTGTTFLATTQVSGRGRGSNVWISAPGSLLFSTKINHAMGNNVTAPVVFLQYIAALAIVEGIQTYDSSGNDSMQALRDNVSPFSTSRPLSTYRDLPVKLKWPNDIYAFNPEKADTDFKDPNSYVKIGGILVNTSYIEGDFHVIVGIGLNVSNSAPTTSLNALVDAFNARNTDQKMQHFIIERLLARILTAFTAIYDHFNRHGFRGELELSYLRHWLHTDQIVILEEERHAIARIKGITMDWGSLIAEEVHEVNGKYEETGRNFALQADNNSFDFFKGLVRRKL